MNPKQELLWSLRVNPTALRGNVYGCLGDVKAKRDLLERALKIKHGGPRKSVQELGGYARDSETP